MARRYIDCREHPSVNHCSVVISADNDEELLDAAVQHGIDAHGHDDTPEFRAELKKAIKTGVPPA